MLNKQVQSQQQQMEQRPKRQDAFKFFQKVNFIYKEINDEKKEINHLKKLILQEEKEIIMKKKKYDEENNNYNNNDNTYFNIKRRSKLRTINPIMPRNFISNNLTNNNILSQINEENIIEKDKKKLNSEESTDIINIKSNNNSQINLTKTDSTNISQHNVRDIYRFSSVAKIMKRRLSSVTFFNKNFGRNKNNKSKNNLIINLRKRRRGSALVENNLNNYLTVDETYEKISLLDFISYNENTIKKREKVTNLLKKFYGNKFQKYDKKNNHIKILNNFMKLKDEIIRTENKDATRKYKYDLPKLMQNKMETCKEQNEKLKNVGEIFIRSFYNKKLKD